MPRRTFANSRTRELTSLVCPLRALMASSSKGNAANHTAEGHSDSEDQFTDAQSAPISESGSPIPKTRVERVDDEPAHGEVPGTEAHALRERDAQPDEIALIPSDDDKSSSSALSEDVPATVVEEASGSVGEHSQEFLDKRQADAAPDVLVGADGVEKSNNGTGK